VTGTAFAERAFERAGDRPILLVHAAERGRRLAERLVGRRPLFVCTVAHTETAEIDGISAAGVTPELRRLTAAADAEALVHGRPRCMDGVPSNPLGAPGPIIITVAALRLAGIPVEVLDAGLRVKPDAPARALADRWGDSILTGRAVPHAAELLASGRALGRELAGRADYLILAESVPGGTTTALAVLCGLGLDAWGKVSSSMPENAHPLKNAVVRQALAAAGLDPVPGPGSRVPTSKRELDPPARDRAPGAWRLGPGRGAGWRSPLAVVAAVGDPMQPVVAGLALEALPRVPVLLAGGSQMAAVLALMAALAEQEGVALDYDRLAIATTSWVARDRTADLAGLVGQVGEAPVLASDLFFGSSRHPPLRRYERFLVKEGVGAGAAAIAAALAVGVDRARLTAEIERVYEEICGVP
jgi:NaMN:DMB phosphoribosyltransferase